MRPFRFLANASEKVEGDELAARARRAEELGHHGLVVPDHLLGRLSPVVAMATVADRALTEEDVLDSPHVLVGSVDRMVEKLEQLREELGITSVLLGEVGDLAPVRERLR